MTAVYLQLAAYACATTFSPGPNNILLFSSTSRYGIRKCWPLIFWDLGGIDHRYAAVRLRLCLAGRAGAADCPRGQVCGRGLYPLSGLPHADAQPRRQEGGRPLGKPLSYVNGFLLQFLNVHILMLGIAAYSGYILPHGYTVPAVLCFSVIMAACAATGNLIWATLGAAVPAVQPVLQICQRRYGAAPALVRLENHLRLRIHGPNALPSREGVFCAEQASPHLLILYNVGRALLRRHPGSGFWGIEAVRQICENLRKLDAAGRLIKSRRCQVND